MPWSDNVAKTVLPNGLTLLVQRDPSAPVVAVVTHVRAGYFDEPDEWVGIAHVLEHMFFKGTERRGPGDVARDTQAVGGYINAGTIYDKTVYYTVLPSAGGGLRDALDIHADALRNAALDADELARELEVIVQEANRKRDTPAAVAFETMLATLYREHRIRRWRIGTEAGLRRLTASDVRAYYESRYTPDRVILSVVGDVVVDHVTEIAAQLFGDWNRPPAVFSGSPPEQSAVTPVVRVLSGDVKRPIGVVGWRTVPALHADEAALDVAAGVLTSGRGSTLYRALRLPGLASSVGTDHYVPTEVGTFALQLEAETESFDTAMVTAMDHVAALAQGGVSAEEVARVKTLLTTQWLRRLESMEGRASAFCEAEALGDVRLLDDAYDRLQAVEVPAVVDVARRYLAPDRSCAVLFHPDGHPTQITDWPPAPNGVTPLAAVPPAVMPTSVSDPAAADLEHVAERVYLSRLSEIDVLIATKAGSGLATVGLHFPGVPSGEVAARAGISWLLARSALRGADGLTGDQLTAHVEQIGGTIGASVRADTLGWWLTVPSGSIAAAARLLLSVAKAPTLCDSDVVTEARLLGSDARRVRDDMFRHPLESVRGQAYPDHAYGLPAIGYPEQVQQLGAADVRAWHEVALAERPVVVVAGDVDPRRSLDALATVGGWAKRRAARSVVPPTFGNGRASESRRKQQSALAMAFPGATYSSPDRYPITVMSAVLSGLAGRLFDELRERRSLAYTVVAMPWLARHAGVVLTYIATSPERESEARDAMLAELRRLVTEPPDDAELDRARQYAAGTVEVRRQLGTAIADDVLAAWTKGSLEDLDVVPERLRAVSRDDVVRVAESVFGTGERAEYVVRGASGDSDVS